MRLLIVGDINSEIKAAIDLAKSRKAKVVMAESCEQALEFLCLGKGADLVLVDVKFDIKSFINSMQGEKISTPVVAYGIQCSPKKAVTAIKSGAKEFLPLPPDERLIAAIFTSIADDTIKIIGKSNLIKEAIKVADKIAKSDANVLITGESGTGKEVFAKYIHNESNRSDHPFVSVNCAAIPENLLESELFGHEKGAFTGALSLRIGKFEESSGGTLLLDEISEMDMRLQAKLLRALQEEEIDRVGGSSPVKVNLRVIATSNRDLQHEIAKGTFREDLYFRLNIINIDLPPLRDRPEDVLSLNEYFIKKYVESNKIQDKILSPAALKKMEQYSWPGNVRQLENIIHRSILLSEGTEIMPEDIDIVETIKQVATNINGDITTGNNDEKQLVFNTLGYCLGDLNKTANILGISINILKEKLENYTKEKVD
ncbi:MAG: sigma-54-dependent Fis family transcriptional regulator [Rickettsiaceae bacterium]|nr:sigma-54-dependent Fis family transcriptional regulator [Rickettsiaceae bacterium]